MNTKSKFRRMSREKRLLYLWLQDKGYMRRFADNLSPRIARGAGTWKTLSYLYETDNTAHEALMAAFTWKDTIQGSIWWRGVNREWIHFLETYEKALT